MQTKADGSVTPRTILIEWADKQDQWIRYLVAEALSSRKPLTSEAIDRAYDLLLREKGLKEGDPVAVGSIAGDTQSRNGGHTLHLTCIRDVENVNALVGGQRIDFNKRFTLLFGENGTGKTGYVRVLKRIASTRTPDDILPDIAASNPQPPSAVIEFELDGTAQAPFTWRNEAGLPPFTSLDIFDAQSAVIRVDSDLTYVYTPSDLALFPRIDDAIEAIGTKLADAQRGATSRSNPYVGRFSRESALYGPIETLGASTDMAAFQQLASISSQEEASLEPIRTQVAALRSNTLADRQQVLAAHRELLNSGQGVIEEFLKLDQGAYEEVRTQLAAARARQLEVSRGAFAGYAIPGVLEEAWRTFIEAGDAYTRATHPDHYPRAGDRCVYCQQALGEAASRLLSQYRDYCSAETRREVEEAEARLRAIADPIAGLDLERLSATVRTTLDRRKQGLAVPSVVDDLGTALPGLLQTAQILKSREALDRDALPDSLRALHGQVSGVLVDVDQQIEQVRRQATDRVKALTEEAARLVSLESRITLRGLLPEITNFVDRAKWVDRARTVHGRFQAVRRTLTDASKLASEDLLNNDFERLFHQEAARLRAPAVRLEFPGRRGQATRRKVIGSHKLSEILSEGEQKVIALADFIAEASLRRTSTPAVLDDPVNSLDYKRIKDIVKRIVTLSADRQIIVFTHNIWFAMELLAQFEKKAAECAFYEVELTDTGKGLVTRGSHPRVDTVTHLRTEINNVITEARPASGATLDALIERGYNRMRAFCEKTVEDELFQGVVARYRLNVMLTRLPQVRTDVMEAAIAAITPVYDKCCEVTEAHSQPLERSSVHPSLADLETDWRALQDARSLYVTQ